MVHLPKHSHLSCC